MRRFARTQADERYLRERTKEALGRLYAMHWPNLQATTARGIRRSPLYDRLQAAGACFGELAQWERANWFAPPGVEPVYEYSFGRQNWFPFSAEEHSAAREAVALFDLSSFAKIEVTGIDAVRLLQHVCTNDVDVPVGKVVYTLFLNGRGGIENDGTVTRLGEDRFLVLTPTATQHRTVEWLRSHAEGMAVSIADVTSASATLAVMGPRSRELLTRLTADDLSNESFPFFTSKEIQVRNAPSLAIRASFVGELGWELYVPTEFAVHVYDAILEVGGDLGLRLAGYHALDSLRIEKGFVHVGHDVGPTDDPYTAGLGHVVRLDKEFVGVEAARAAKQSPGSHRLVSLKLEDAEPILLHGESVIVGGRIAGTVMSGAYAHTIGAAAGLAMVDAAILTGRRDDRAGGLRGNTREGDPVLPCPLRPHRFTDASLAAVAWMTCPRTRSLFGDASPRWSSLWWSGPRRSCSGLLETPLRSAHLPSAEATRDRGPENYLAWVPGGFDDPNFRQRMERLAGLDEAVVVAGDTLWLRKTEDADGRVVDEPTRPFAFPIDVFAVDGGPTPRRRDERRDRIVRR